MLPIEIAPGVHWIGVNDRTVDLFEGLWPVGEEGVSYNAYVVKGEKTALIDLAKGNQAEGFFDQVRAITDLADVDYLVVNHLEPDHSGLLLSLRTLAPNIQILCTAKAQAMLAEFYDLTDGVRAVADGETLSLGSTALQFFSAPFVHWPETMVTYHADSKTLFSCDAFGGYGALRGALFDGDYADIAFYERESLRYFVNIIAKFCRPVLKAIEKLGTLDIAAIAPSHGLVWRKNPGRIVELYRRWANYANEPAEQGVTLLYGSMYGFTELMMNAVASGIQGTGVPMSIFDVARTHVSYLLPALWVNRGVMIGAPTYEGELFPAMAQVLDMAITKTVRHKKVARFGSFGWSGGAQKDCDKRFDQLQWDLTDVLEFCGRPNTEQLARGVEFGRRFAKAVQG